MISKLRIWAASLAFVPAVLSADCRFTLADQSNFNARSGFYLDLENIASSSQTCQIQDLHLYLGSADGSQWRFIGTQPTWQFDHDYVAKAVIAPSYSELYLDDQLISHVPGAFAGLPAQMLTANGIPGWASGTTTYLVSQTSLSAASSSGATTALGLLPSPASVPLALLSAGTANPQSVMFPFGAADTITITAGFRLTAQPGAQSFAPYVDTYGQSIYSTFPGKIGSDADLQAAAASEQQHLAAWGQPTGFDRWGGVLDASWHDAATGFFHVTQHNGVWWLISPNGNPCFYTGVDTAPLTTGNNTPVTGREWEFATLPTNIAPFTAAWGYGDWGNTGISSTSFDTWNMIRKYGAVQWQTTATSLAVQRIQDWGFSGLGKWASDAGNLPILPVLYTASAYLTRHQDIFDPAVQAQMLASLQSQIQPRVSDPRILGWSYGNEYDGIVDPQEIQQILGMASTVPAKRALMTQALNVTYKNNVAAMASAWNVTAGTLTELYTTNPNPPATDIEMLRQYFEDKYYDFLYTTIKSVDSNHLYFGFWIVPGWWQGPVDWQLNANHVDVIGFDRYSSVFQDSTLEQLFRSTGKPTFVGEFSFPSTYNLARGYRAYPFASAVDDAGAGDLYRSWLQSAARNPWCVGLAWFEYRDEPVSGRGFLGETDLNLVEGESYAFGLVDAADRPKYDLVEKVRTTNLGMAARRLAYAPPVLNSGGMVNAASYSHSAVSPGSIVAVFGSNLAADTVSARGAPQLSVSGAALTVGGVPMPLMYVGPTQASAQVPWELAGQTQAELSIITDDLTGNTISVPIAPFSPGIFTVDASGSGQGAILLASTGTLATTAATPAHPGDFISIYATGLGPVTNQSATGAPSTPFSETLSMVSVTIGGMPATVSFSGLAPGFVGLYQVNAQVPAGAPSGTAVAVVVSVSNVQSNQVTMAIQ